MADVVQSGSGRVGEASIGNHGSLSLSQVLCVYPGQDNLDRPLPNIAGFDRLADMSTPDEIAWLVQWVEPQTTCSYIMRNHGAEGLKRVLAGIAKACAAKRIHMGNRVAIAATALGFEVI